ncbi:hypothetical protein DFH94DRAFT_843486 [Russula ochroleuca]|uniref:Uncharacterized protein n=1 Tax=Russula ochroleuca TaxID=152965 RepID=A0A9P5N1R5_9AGAM|nr:hypothetical protein DFH94DRAFT_843486 [Russula ochroleuca]
MHRTARNCSPSHYPPPSSPSRKACCRQPWANKAGSPTHFSAPCHHPRTPCLRASTLLNERLRDLGSSTRYEAEVAGGHRRSSDDFELRWEVMPPARGEKPGATRLRSSDTAYQHDQDQTPNMRMCWGIAHLRVLAPPSVFAGVANELTAIMGEQPIEVVQEEGDEEEEEGEEPRELVWLLDLTGQVAPKWQPQLVLCDPDVENEAELRFLQTHGAGLSQVKMPRKEVKQKGKEDIHRKLRGNHKTGCLVQGIDYNPSSFVWRAVWGEKMSARG